MDNIDTEVLFPLRVIPQLVDLRGDDWQSLVESVLSCSDDSIEKIAFVLMMVRLGGCVTCNSNSFRAMRGCTDCAQRTIRRYRDDDSDLKKNYFDCLDELKKQQ
jgi:hypothetical protein